MIRLEAFIIFGTATQITMTSADHKNETLALLAIPKPNRCIYTFYAKNYHEASKLYKKMFDNNILPLWGRS
jgi:hypothetical protein